LAVSTGLFNFNAVTKIIKESSSAASGADVAEPGVVAMLIDGVVIMTIGMITVFVFLCIMVAMVEMIAFFMRAGPANVTAIAPDAGVLQNEVSSSEEIAVILAAVRDYTQGENS